MLLLLFPIQAVIHKHHPYPYLSPPPTYVHCWDIYLQLYIWVVWLILLIAQHVIARLLLDKTYSPLEISIRQKFSCILLELASDKSLVTFYLLILCKMFINDQFVLRLNLALVFQTHQQQDKLAILTLNEATLCRSYFNPKLHFYGNNLILLIFAL